MSRRSARDSDAATHLSVVEAWLETQTSLNTRAAYRADLETFGRWCASHGSMPLRADAATLVRFQAARQAAGDSASTVRRRWSALSSFYQFALENDVTATNPALAAARPKVLTGDPSPTPLLSSQAVDAYRALAAALDPRLEALVALLVFDGLKLGEALALDIEDVTGRPPRMSLTIRRHGVAKRIALDPDSARAVYRCAGRRLGGPLFTSARPSSQDQPRRLTRFGADHLIKQLNTSGEARVTANALRRFHITASHEAGTDLDSVRERAGLAHVRTVRRYLRHRT